MIYLAPKSGLLPFQSWLSNLRVGSCGPGKTFKRPAECWFSHLFLTPEWESSTLDFGSEEEACLSGAHACLRFGVEGQEAGVEERTAGSLSGGCPNRIPELKEV